MLTITFTYADSKDAAAIARVLNGATDLVVKQLGGLVSVTLVPIGFVATIDARSGSEAGGGGRSLRVPQLLWTLVGRQVTRVTIATSETDEIEIPVEWISEFPGAEPNAVGALLVGWAQFSQEVRETLVSQCAEAIQLRRELERVRGDVADADRRASDARNRAEAAEDANELISDALEFAQKQAEAWQEQLELAQSGDKTGSLVSLLESSMREVRQLIAALSASVSQTSEVQREAQRQIVWAGAQQERIASLTADVERLEREAGDRNLSLIEADRRIADLERQLEAARSGADPSQNIPREPAANATEA